MRAFSVLGLTFLALGVGVGATLADTTSNPGSISPSSEQNSLTGNVLGANFNPMQLIHNANFMNGRDATMFNEEAGENITNATDDYKDLLLQWWQQQKGSHNPSATVITPAQGTPPQP